MKNLFVGLFLVVSTIMVAQDFDIKPRGLTLSGARELKRFGKIPFYANMEKVRKLSKVPLSEPLDKDRLKIIFGKDMIAGMEAQVFYYFIDDELLMGNYLFNQEHTSTNLYIDDYYTIKKIIVRKFGGGDIKDKYWLDDYYSDVKSAEGIAVATGHLMYYTIWDFDNGKIELEMTGDNYKIELKVIYSLNEFVKKRDKMDLLKDLYNDQF